MAKSSGSAKSKEQRDVERRKRQLEKLPSPIALHDHQYPQKKSVLSDQNFQRPVYSNHFDTPELYTPTPPDDFFVHWNIRDCGRTAYPPVPEIDHRYLCPSADTDLWQEHRSEVVDYLHKHQIVPGMFPSVASDCNLSVVFDDSAEFTRENFWRSAHCGNFIELKECQRPPQVRFLTGTANDDSLYTLVMASPDYPARASPNRGFFVHWVCSNMAAGGGQGDSLVPFVPPLPTEDAGSARVLFLLYKQSGKIAGGQTDLSFDQRSDFRLHDSQRDALKELDQRLEDAPRAVSFFQTVWDIQVQEWYERAGIPEPAYVPDDIEAILATGAMPKEHFQISSKTLPDGSVNDTGKVQLHQGGETMHHRRQANKILSARTKLSKDRKEYVMPA